MKNYVKVTLSISENYQDLIIGQLSNIGFNGFIQENSTLNCFIPQNKWSDNLKFKFVNILKSFLQEFPSQNNILNYSHEIIRPENWNKKWEDNTGIIEATKNIIIKPSWKKLPNKFKNKIVIHINPKMSFGTGHHETTRLSLMLIEKYIQDNKYILDFGCGTGVLGIACIKLGAQKVVGVDIDPWSQINAKENIAINNVKNKIKIILGSISKIPKNKFDLIVANIDYMTITKFIKSLCRHLKKDSKIILSGILTQDLPTLTKLFKEHSLLTLDVLNENEWSAVTLVKK